MKYYRWRVKLFDPPKWVDYRYFKTDYPAFLRLLKNRRKEASQLNIQLKPGGAFMNPGGTDNLLWISKRKVSFGKTREYWEDVLKRAKEEALSQRHS